MGFEPTILGSEGPRLSPGSTTGPVSADNRESFYCLWAVRILVVRRNLSDILIRNLRPGDESGFLGAQSATFRGIGVSP